MPLTRLPLMHADISVATTIKASVIARTKFLTSKIARRIELSSIYVCKTAGARNSPPFFQHQQIHAIGHEKKRFSTMA
jgi:hypothetical protein